MKFAFAPCPLNPTLASAKGRLRPALAPCVFIPALASTKGRFTAAFALKKKDFIIYRI